MRILVVWTTMAALTLGCNGGPDNCAYAPAQGPAEPCCTSWGADACGAGFFCAAFDGRTIATCYANGSRLDGQTCTADDQCGSMSCNTAAGACRTLGSTCDPRVGCASRPIGGIYVCDPVDATCRPVGNGGRDALCSTDTDCRSPLLCDSASQRCTGEIENAFRVCSTDSDCTAFEGTPVCRLYARDTSGAFRGYCTTRCDAGPTGCPEGTRCVGSDPYDACVVPCSTAEDCPLPQLGCVDRGDGYRCQGCNESSECRAGQTCVELETNGECR